MSRITDLFKIKYPIIQGGMAWCSNWKLASAVSNSGGLGLIGCGSMSPTLLQSQIRKCKDATDKPFGVNLPLVIVDKKELENYVNIIIKEKIKIVFTAAGNPATYIKKFKENGIKVAHVVANLKGAIKCQEVGVDAIVAEGNEAGGHLGREETTTLVLIPLLRNHVKLPIIAAGGIGTGRGMLACMALGAEGVQIGTRFIASIECSAHEKFKKRLVKLKEGETICTLKNLIPSRVIKNK